MSEQTEWEIIDAPAADKRKASRQTLKSLLGPAWRWKIAGAVVLATMALLFIFVIAGTVMVVITAGALISLAVSKLRSWLRRNDTPAPLQKW